MPSRRSPPDYPNPRQLLSSGPISQSLTNVAFGQYHHTVAAGSVIADCQLPIFDWRLVTRQTNISSSQRISRPLDFKVSFEVFTSPIFPTVGLRPVLNYVGTSHHSSRRPRQQSQEHLVFYPY